MKYYFMCLVVIMLSGCATTENHYVYSATMTEPVYSESLTYSDNDFSIHFNLESTRIKYELKNHTNKGIRINWDEVGFINVTGRSMRLMHGGVNYSDRNLSQIPSITAPKTVSNDILIPTANVYFDSSNSIVPESTKYVHYSSSQYGGWKELYLFPKNCRNCTFGLYFPLIINGNKKEFNFKFKLDKYNEISDRADGTADGGRNSQQ